VTERDAFGNELAPQRPAPVPAAPQIGDEVPAELEPTAPVVVRRRRNGRAFAASAGVLLLVAVAALVGASRGSERSASLVGTTAEPVAVPEAPVTIRPLTRRGMVQALALARAELGEDARHVRSLRVTVQAVAVRAGRRLVTVGTAGEVGVVEDAGTGPAFALDDVDPAAPTRIARRLERLRYVELAGDGERWFALTATGSATAGPDGRRLERVDG
jgi:hypothetical protein